MHRNSAAGPGVRLDSVEGIVVDWQAKVRIQGLREVGSGMPVHRERPADRRTDDFDIQVFVVSQDISVARPEHRRDAERDEYPTAEFIRVVRLAVRPTVGTAGLVGGRGGPKRGLPRRRLAGSSIRRPAAANPNDR